MDELGIYSVTASVAAIVGVLTGIVNTILAPIIYKMSADGKYTTTNQMILNDRILVATLFIFVIGGLTNWIVPMLFPPVYQNIDSFILCCVASPLLYTLSEVSSIGINLARKTSFVLFAILCALVVNSVGNYYLVPSFGASGAAIATAVGFYCYFLVKVLSANHVMAKVPIAKLLGFPLICILLMISEAYFNLDTSFIFRVLWVLMGLAVAISLKTSLIEFKQLFLNYLKDRLATRG
jgi:O-antigen/teichoic acid export membrane protein